jgi:ABC-type transport system substrate-binding protein
MRKSFASLGDKKLNKKTKSLIIAAAITSLFLLSAFAIQPTHVTSASPFFTLVAKTSAGGDWPDYLNFLNQHLSRIGINVNVQILDWPAFVMELMAFRDFDIALVGIGGGGADPDFTGVYDENGSLNLFGYHTSMDYNETLGTGLNEWYMKQGTLIMPPDSQERVQHYWEWEQYFMDKICPLLPLTSPMVYVAHWSNLLGYNNSDGITQSWGKMTFDGSHDGQISSSELVIRQDAWSDLNPLFQDDADSSFISGLTLDNLIRYDAQKQTHPYLAKWWRMINDTHVRINVRQGIKWQDDPDGLFVNEYFDIDDVYFTIYSWGHVSNEPYTWDWVKKMERINSTCMDIFIDGDRSTPENDPYAPFLPSLSLEILPEHYLNQTQLSDGITPDVNHKSWTTYATHCFGTGLFEFGTFTEGVETIMDVYDDCWLTDPSVDKSDMDMENLFGDFTGGINRIRVREIPDIQTALLEFEAGKLDIVSVTINPEKRDAYNADPTKNVQSRVRDYFDFFGFNMRETRQHIGSREPCPGDPTMSVGLAIRKAICYAVDRIEINEVVNAGEFQISDWPIYPTYGVFCNPNIIRYNHDLDLAREYMELAGFTATTDTNGTPGFGYWLTMASILAVSTITVLFSKKKK